MTSFHIKLKKIILLNKFKTIEWNIILIRNEKYDRTISEKMDRLKWVSNSVLKRYSDLIF